MSEEQSTSQVSSETAVLMDRLLDLDPTDERYQVLKAALDYKTSWLALANHLNLVALNKQFKGWGYKNFKAYCLEEIQIPQTTAKKLVNGYQWIDQEAPEVLTQFVQVLKAAENGDLPENFEPRAVPDFDAIDVLVTAQKEVNKQRLSDAVYADLRQKALGGDVSARDLKKQMNEALPEKIEAQDVAELKLLRRTLSSTEKTLAQLEIMPNLDQEIVVLLERLRERLFEVVSQRLDAQAYEGDEAS